MHREYEPAIKDRFQKEWDKVVKNHMLEGWLYKTGIPSCDIPDLINETALQAYGSVNKLDDWDNFIPWLTGILRNTCRRYWRSLDNIKRKQNKVVENITHRQVFASSPEISIANKLLLENCTSLLSEEEKNILLLRAVENYTWDEIANIIGHPRSTVARWYDNIIAKLRARIQ